MECARWAQIMRPYPYPNVGFGATFHKSQQAYQASGQVPMPNQAPLRLLILEERSHDAGELVRELHRQGVDCVAQSFDAGETLVVSLDPRPDLILAEYGPNRDGALRSLRAVRALYTNVPLIVVANSCEEDAIA